MKKIVLPESKSLLFSEDPIWLDAVHVHAAVFRFTIGATLSTSSYVDDYEMSVRVEQTAPWSETLMEPYNFLPECVSTQGNTIATGVPVSGDGYARVSSKTLILDPLPASELKIVTRFVRSGGSQAPPYQGYFSWSGVLFVSDDYNDES